MTTTTKSLEGTEDWSYLGHITTIVSGLSLGHDERQDLSFHLSEAYPGLETIVGGIGDGSLTVEDLRTILADVLNHLDEVHKALSGPRINPFDEHQE